MFFGALSIFGKASAIQPLTRLALLVESDCTLCGAMRQGEVCAACMASLAPASRHVAGHVCAYEYRFPLDALLRRFKYGGDLAIGRWLALRLAERIETEPRPALIVVPPSTRARLRERGFNPALEIAKVVAGRCDVRLDRTAVARRHEDAPQAGLSRSRRLRNLRGAFACTRRLDGLDVAIVDDVVTTGATSEAMSRALKSAGAARVRVWAVARTPPPGG